MYIYIYIYIYIYMCITPPFSLSALMCSLYQGVPAVHSAAAAPGAAGGATSSGRVFIRNMIPHRGLEQFLQK